MYEFKTLEMRVGGQTVWGRRVRGGVKIHIFQDRILFQPQCLVCFRLFKKKNTKVGFPCGKKEKDLSGEISPSVPLMQLTFLNNFPTD
jgi:hypothetical protein